MHRFQRAFALALWLSIIVLLAISLYAFADNLGQGGKDAESTLTRLLNGHSLTLAQDQAVATSDRRPEMTIEGEQLSLRDKKLSASIRVSLQSGAQKEMVDANTNKPIYSCDSSNVCTVKPQYANKMINVSVITASPEAGGQSEFSKDIPLKAFDQTILNEVVVPVTLPMSGFSNLYPQDYYFFDVIMNLFLPDGIIRQVNGKDPTGEDADHYFFDGGNAANNQSVSVRPLLDTKNKPVVGEFHVSFHRTVQSQLYIYSVALIPLIFALLFLHLLFFSRHFHHKVFEEFTEALIVAILAVLPLRAVLVPAELEGLTRVDLVLGMGLVLIVGVAVGKYAAEVWAAGFAGHSLAPEGGHTEAEGDSHIRRVAEDRSDDPGTA